MARSADMIQTLIFKKPLLSVAALSTALLASAIAK
jgi:hypothetical protein